MEITDLWTLYEDDKQIWDFSSRSLFRFAFEEGQCASFQEGDLILILYDLRVVTNDRFGSRPE